MTPLPISALSPAKRLAASASYLEAMAKKLDDIYWTFPAGDPQRTKIRLLADAARTLAQEQRAQALNG